MMRNFYFFNWGQSPYGFKLLCFLHFHDAGAKRVEVAYNSKSVTGDPQRGREKSSESFDGSRLAPGAELSLLAPQISSGWDWFDFKR